MKLAHVCCNDLANSSPKSADISTLCDNHGYDHSVLHSVNWMSLCFSWSVWGNCGSVWEAKLRWHEILHAEKAMATYNCSHTLGIPLLNLLYAVRRCSVEWVSLQWGSAVRLPCTSTSPLLRVQETAPYTTTLPPTNLSPWETRLLAKCSLRRL